MPIISKGTFMGIPYIRCLIFLVVTLVSGCDDSPNSASTTTPDIIRIAPLPDHAPELMRERYLPIIDYLTKQTGIKTELVIADSYQHLLDLFHTGDIDIANFGGVTFIKARKLDGAKPMVLRDIDGLFSSVVLVNADIHAEGLQALKGKAFAFGSPLSTSGHLMPRYFFNKQNITPEDFFSKIEYSGAHDKTVYMVRDKEVSGGVANAGIVDEMYLDGRINKSKVRVLWESPTYADYVWAIQPHISGEIKSQLESAFINLQSSDPAQKKLLDKLNANYYISANDGDFSVLEGIYNELEEKGLLK